MFRKIIQFSFVFRGSAQCLNLTNYSPASSELKCNGKVELLLLMDMYALNDSSVYGCCHLNRSCMEQNLCFKPMKLYHIEFILHNKQ